MVEAQGVRSSTLRAATIFEIDAVMAELVDALGSGPSRSNPVLVQVQLTAFIYKAL